ncbi:chymotrypsin-2-like [Vespula squamosa]|uniref:Chymotrypsin-2 n=1 Tax=Vespula squamosa TaxID=30214 RepID=A0ABD2C4Y3_VESSQ
MIINNHMTMQAVTTLLILFLATATYGVPTGRVVGGTDAPQGKYPYQVSLRAPKHFCGGSIINKRYILTAAHCLVRKSPNQITVHAGSVRLDQEEAVYRVEKLIINKNYNSFKLINDIALIRVSKDITFTQLVQPVKLPVSNTVKAGDAVVLTGWGRIYLNGPIPNNLQQITLAIVNQKSCKAKHWGLTDSHVCTFTKRGQGACHGDSGGPLVANGVQIGIVSYGHPCALGSPDVFTRVYSFLDWIQNNQL